MRSKYCTHAISFKETPETVIFIDTINKSSFLLFLTHNNTVLNIDLEVASLVNSVCRLRMDDSVVQSEKLVKSNFKNYGRFLKGLF